MKVILLKFGVAAMAIVTTSGASAEHAGLFREFTVVERAISDTVTDIGAEGDSPGDLLTFNNPLFDAANLEEVGRANGVCIRTVVGKAWECAWTNRLTDGQINVAGTFQDEGESLLAVTGGTGNYVGASGQMLLRFRDPQGSAFDFIFSLEKERP